jgi:hypothetical protein
VTPPAAGTALRSNRLYRVVLAASQTCRVRVRRPKPPFKDDALGPYLRTVVDCLVATFNRPLAAQGFSLTTPRVRTYRGTASTPCGDVGSHGSPAYYCAGTIYWPVTGDDQRQAYTLARLGYVGLLAHEFGHHLQATTGMLTEYDARHAAADQQQRHALSRRLELQASCFEGVFLGHQASLRLTGRDRAELRRWHSYTGDEDPPASRRPDHGTSRAQVRWLERGLSKADLGRCNTWTAGSSTVR